MNTTSLDSTLEIKPAVRMRKRDRIVQALQPMTAKQRALPLAYAMCAALGATSVQAFAAQQRYLVAGIVPKGVAICDGEQSYVVSEAELQSLLDDVEKQF